MPHTNRPNSKSKSSKTKKRLQVTDSTGWTHVTTHSRPPPPNPNPNPTDEESRRIIPPAEPPTNLTLSALQTHFARHHERFLASECWRTIRNVVSTSVQTDQGLGQADTGVAQIVSLALGSPSGFLRGGWVDRRAVSMDQVVALVCIRDILRESSFSLVYNYVSVAVAVAKL